MEDVRGDAAASCDGLEAEEGFWVDSTLTGSDRMTRTGVCAGSPKRLPWLPIALVHGQCCGLGLPAPPQLPGGARSWLTAGIPLDSEGFTGLLCP